MTNTVSVAMTDACSLSSGYLKIIPYHKINVVVIFIKQILDCANELYHYIFINLKICLFIMFVFHKNIKKVHMKIVYSKLKSLNIARIKWLIL